MARKELLLVSIVAGIYVCYMLYAILQEKVTKSEYGPEKEKFTFTFFLLFCQCLVAAMAARAAIYLGAINIKGGPPQSKYAMISSTYLTAMLASNGALLYIDYPTQVLAKACKPIPVMLVGVVLGKRYKWYKWLFVSLIVVGISLFMFKDKANAGGAEGVEYLMGVGLLALSLACDGCTGPMQEKVFSGSNRPPALAMMFYSNVFASLYCFVAMLLMGQLVPAIDFCTRYPVIVFDILGYTLLSALGQNFIYMMISNFDSLVCSITTTTRKFFTILVSVLYYGHALSGRQWTGVALVFAGLGLDVIVGYMQPKHRKPVRVPAEKSE